MPPVVNIAGKLKAISECWRPAIAGEVGEMHVKLVKLSGEFVWHHHENEDEMFLVMEGELVMRFLDGDQTLRPGEFIVVPKGVEHCPVAAEGASVMLFEPKGTLNTGNIRSERTVEKLERI